MGQEEPQNRQGSPQFQLIPWAIAIVFISLLGACFIASCLVTHYNFLHCKGSTGGFQLPEHHTALTCIRGKSERKGTGSREHKDWSCCPKGWEPFSLNCYFISTKDENWNESEKNCSGMKAHLLVINTKAEQEFITGKLEKKNAYFVGLSDPEGTGHWQWVDQTPYNRSATFWHLGEPSHPDERCAVLNARQQRWWGLNDIPCDLPLRSICEMMKIYF
ncbi:C-type lectin domain family 4 member C-like isoform X2 [Rhinolophus sinicus]|uniref:C-type lectin domain family 4 member C-like isoform X2 n=1 Tax=Rhinolophus sinicus TaxID=89399 RepID=UPI003D7AA488